MNANDMSTSRSKVMFCKRKTTLKKKAEELSKLCGVPVCLICFEPDGTKIDTWPEDKKEVGDILVKYIYILNKDNIDLQLGFMDANNKNQDLVAKEESCKHEEEKKKKKKKMFETWNTRLDYLPEESLHDILKFLEQKAEILEERIMQMAMIRVLAAKSNQCIT